MLELKSNANPKRPKVGLIILTTMIGLILTLTIVTAQSPNFYSSFKSGPLYAKLGDVITYTIVTINTGDPVQNVILTDTLPNGIEFVPGSCSYDDGNWTWPCDDDPPNPMWGPENFGPGYQITTTFAATVTTGVTGTLHLPLINHAYVSWDTGQQELAFTTTVLSKVPEFDLFYEPEPPNVDTDEEIDYSIIAVNSGDPVTNVILSNFLPDGVTFVPGSCSYIISPLGSATLLFPCNDLVPGQNQTVWMENLARDTRITTTFRVTVTTGAGSARWPLQNCAYLDWSVVQEEACATSLINPTVYVYMPLTMRNSKHDFYEPNDTPEQASGPLVSGRVYRAFIWDATDQDDYYHITPLSDTTTVHVELTSIPVSRDYDLYIYYDLDGEYPLVTSSARGGNLDESVDFIPVPDRKYYIRVYSDMALGGGFSDEDPYDLVVTLGNSAQTTPTLMQEQSMTRY